MALLKHDKDILLNTSLPDDKVTKITDYITWLH